MGRKVESPVAGAQTSHRIDNASTSTWAFSTDADEITDSCEALANDLVAASANIHLKSKVATRSCADAAACRATRTWVRPCRNRARSLARLDERRQGLTTARAWCSALGPLGQPIATTSVRAANPAPFGTGDDSEGFIGLTGTRSGATGDRPPRKTRFPYNSREKLRRHPGN